jgi:hypothetical protein
MRRNIFGHNSPGRDNGAVAYGDTFKDRDPVPQPDTIPYFDRLDIIPLMAHQDRAVCGAMIMVINMDGIGDQAIIPDLDPSKTNSQKSPVDEIPGADPEMPLKLDIMILLQDIGTPQLQDPEPGIKLSLGKIIPAERPQMAAMPQPGHHEPHPSDHTLLFIHSRLALDRDICFMIPAIP